MTIWISMLRGINLGSHNKIPMLELARLYESLGFANVRTYVQSGNVVFESDPQNPETITTLAEAKTKDTFGYAVNVFMRDRTDFQRLLDHNPFTHERNEDPSRLHVTFLYRPPAALDLSKLVAPASDGDEFSIGEQEIFLFCPNGYGRTKLSNNFFERKLGQPATTRNWKTVNALYDMTSPG